MNNAYLFPSFIALFNSTSSSPQSVPFLVSSYLLPAFLDTVYILFLSSFYHSLKTDTVATLRYCARVNTSSYMKWRYALPVIHSVEEHPAGETLPRWSTHSVVGRVQQKKKRVSVKPNTQIGIDRKKVDVRIQYFVYQKTKEKGDKERRDTFVLYKVISKCLQQIVFVFSQGRRFPQKMKRTVLLFLIFVVFEQVSQGMYWISLQFFLYLFPLKLYRYFPFFFTIYLSFSLFPLFF